MINHLTGYAGRSADWTKNSIVELGRRLADDRQLIIVSRKRPVIDYAGLALRAIDAVQRRRSLGETSLSSTGRSPNDRMKANKSRKNYA